MIYLYTVWILYRPIEVSEQDECILSERSQLIAAETIVDAAKLGDSQFDCDLSEVVETIGDKPGTMEILRRFIVEANESPEEITLHEPAYEIGDRDYYLSYGDCRRVVDILGKGMETHFSSRGGDVGEWIMSEEWTEMRKRF
jgi:hypothetical protein